MCCVTGICHQRSRLFMSDVSKLLTVVLVRISQVTLYTRNFREEWIYGKHNVITYYSCNCIVFFDVAPDVSTFCDTAKIILASLS